MPVTQLDPKTALILVDLQKGIVAMAEARGSRRVAEQAGVLARAFRHLSLPVVLVHVLGGAPGRTEQPPRGGDRPADWADFVPELSRQPEDHTVAKRTWGAFTKTGLEEHLRALGVTQVVVAGISTSIGVESTARQAYELGFNVTLAIDAMTDLSLEAHHHSLTRIFPRLGETGSTREILELLERVSSGEEGES